MKLKTVVTKLLAKHSLGDLLGTILQTVEWEKLLLQLANRSVGLAYHAKTKKKKRAWYGLSRIFHRAYDEINEEKAGKKPVFKVSRRDIYECKCKKRFLVDPGRDKNCKFDLDEAAVVVTCPHCGRNERTAT